MIRHVVVVAALVGSGCTHVYVANAGSTRSVAAKPPDCLIGFFRTQLPSRPYTELASIQVEGRFTSPAEAQRELGARACTLGADAVLVQTEFQLEGRTRMAGVAVQYRYSAEDRARALAQLEELATRTPPAVAAAAGAVPVVVRYAFSLLSAPDGAARPVKEISTGAAVWAAPVDPRGYRRVWTLDGSSGFGAAGVFIERGALGTDTTGPTAPGNSI